MSLIHGDLYHIVSVKLQPLVKLPVNVESFEEGFVMFLFIQKTYRRLPRVFKIDYVCRMWIQHLFSSPSMKTLQLTFWEGNAYVCQPPSRKGLHVIRVPPMRQSHGRSGKCMCEREYLPAAVEASQEVGLFWYLQPMESIFGGLVTLFKGLRQLNGIDGDNKYNCFLISRSQLWQCYSKPTPLAL